MAEQQTLKDELGELSSIMNNISIAIDKHIQTKKDALPAFVYKMNEGNFTPTEFRHELNKVDMLIKKNTRPDAESLDNLSTYLKSASTTLSALDWALPEGATGQEINLKAAIGIGINKVDNTLLNDSIKLQEKSLAALEEIVPNIELRDRTKLKTTDELRGYLEEKIAHLNKTIDKSATIDTDDINITGTSRAAAAEKDGKER